MLNAMYAVADLEGVKPPPFRPKFTVHIILKWKRINNLT